MLKFLMAAVVGLSLCGCKVLAALDFGGDPKSDWEFRWGFEHGIHDSSAPPGQVDDRGIYKPETPEVDSILGFPNIHAGVAGQVRPAGRVTPVVAIEACRVKVPWLRWWELQVGAGNQLVEASFTKRLVSVFEVTAGPWIGWNYDFHALAWGFCFTLIKF
jgi:hypothetical protein